MDIEQLTHRVARRFTAASHKVYDGKYNYDIKGESVYFEIRLFHKIEGYTLEGFQKAHDELVRVFIDDAKNEIKLALEDMEIKPDFEVVGVPEFHKGKAALDAWKVTLKVEFESNDPHNAVARVQETLEDMGMTE